MVVIRLYLFAQISCCKTNYAKRYGKWAVVTGATDGIGLVMAKELAKNGLSIIIVGRNEQKLASSKEQIESEAANVEDIVVLTVKADLSDQSLENYQEIRQQIDPDNRQIGMLINNAGICPEDMKNFDQYDEQEFTNIVNVNIISLLHFSKMILPGMIKRERGCIVNISSILGQLPCPYLNVYGPSKAFVDRFTTNLQIEYKTFPIDIIHVTPSTIQTKLFHNVSDNKFTHKEQLFIPSANYFGKTCINAISTRITQYCGCFGHSLTKALVDMYYYDCVKNFILQITLGTSTKYKPSKFVPKKKIKKNDELNSVVTSENET